MERRVAAVLATDMAGYSRLVELDEVGTLKRQKRHLQELIEPTIVARNGRIVKFTGDGLIAEFSSVVEAVQCAVSIQAEMAAREEEFSDDKKIRYRMAIHLGDVIFDEGDVYGDGVNVAARLEGLAAPGGVVVSGTAYDVLKANVDVTYKSLGEQRLKNIATPVRVYQVVEGAPIAPAFRAPRRVGWLAAAVALLATLGGLVWWFQRPEFEPLNPEELAFALPGKPSLAVLPFENLSMAEENRFVADGLTDSLITTLASAPKLFVIGKKSSFAYTDKARPASQIAEELGVRYLVGGSVQIAETSLRVSAHLIDATTGQQIWAKRFDGEFAASGVFEIQDNIVRSILVQLDASLVSGDFAFSLIKDAGDLEVYELITQAIAEIEKFRPDADLKAKSLLEEAVKLNPKSASAHGYLSWLYLSAIFLGYSQDPTVSLAQARRHAETALALNPDYYHGHIGQAWLHLYSGEHDKAARSAERALELLPGEATNAAMVGWILSASGDPERGETLLRYGLRTQPHPPIWVPSLLAFALLMQGQNDEAQELYKAALEVFPNPMATAHLAALSVFNGQQEDAKKYAELTRQISPNSTVARNAAYWGYLRDKAFLEQYLDALRQAGLPES
ncbi:adenylate/guanylate cyclase domain-containing protein [Ruegeria aquimaris]|uniref:Guanylate cyclase domain-containing protein n=1 Tax=Ruegeria aquimaris TaxID=2984333 RepID=A0ABT3AQ83_9RHOB|nr:tetratricopeptide repeat protein [Ruegeria sp. XHP0148]MCV2890236.1 hypothetical protein [Ruegeria sp. XHP0148]